MATADPGAVRSRPDPAITSASRAPTAPELRALDRQLGWLEINRWTYRIWRGLSALRPRGRDTQDVSIIEETSAGRGALVVRPDVRTGSGAVLLFHGGGFVLGANCEILAQAVDMARAAGVPVICPAYRRLPEAPFPAALDDGHAAWTWLLETADALAIDPAQVVIGGMSAGGGLAAALAQRLFDEGGLQPVAQLLIYPMLDDRTATRRDLDTPRHRVWSNRSNRFGWHSYLGRPPGGPVPAYAVPARRAALSGLPPAWIGVGTPDLFLDEDRDYARRLSDAGGDVTYVEVDGAIHGFDFTETAIGDAFGAAQAAFLRRFVA